MTVRRVKTPAGAPNFTRGWLSRLAAKRPQKLDFCTWSPKRRTGNQTKARRLRPANADPSTGLEKPQYRPACGRARILLARVRERLLLARRGQVCVKFTITNIRHINPPSPWCRAGWQAPTSTKTPITNQKRRQQNPTCCAQCTAPAVLAVQGRYDDEESTRPIMAKKMAFGCRSRLTWRWHPLSKRRRQRRSYQRKELHLRLFALRALRASSLRWSLPPMMTMMVWSPVSSVAELRVSRHSP